MRHLCREANRLIASASALFDVAILGLATTSSVILGAVLGLYVPFPKKVLAGVLAFAAGSLIAALAIELGFEGASQLARRGANIHAAWATPTSGSRTSKSPSSSITRCAASPWSSPSPISWRRSSARGTRLTISA